MFDSAPASELIQPSIIYGKTKLPTKYLGEKTRI